MTSSASTMAITPSSKSPKAAPISRDPVKTRARLLKTASAEFATKGFSGARTRQIAKKAGCSIRMLYHYFGSKDALYVEVLENALSRLRQKELQLDFDDAEPMDGIVRMFDFIDTHFGTSPELRSLLAFENLNRARHLKRSAAIRSMASPVITLIGMLLRRGQADGTFRCGIDPLHLYVSMVSLAYYSKAHAPTLSQIFATDLSSTGWQLTHHTHIRQMLAAYLKAPSS